VTKPLPKVQSAIVGKKDRRGGARQGTGPKPGKQQKAKNEAAASAPGQKSMDNFFKSATPSTVVAATEAVREASNDGPPAALLPDPEPTEMLAANNANAAEDEHRTRML
jgi:hypothetical protein